MDQAGLDRVQSEVAVEMDAAMEFGIKASYPDPSKVGEDVYA